MGVKWFRDRVEDAIRRAAVPVLDAIGRDMVRELKERVSVPGHGVPSDPFTPPHLQTGKLRASIRHEVDRANLRVHVIVDHPAAAYLEYGTRTMAPRPFLRSSLLSRSQGWFPSRFRGFLGARHVAPDTIPFV